MRQWENHRRAEHEAAKAAAKNTDMIDGAGEDAVNMVVNVCKVRLHYGIVRRMKE
jgi:hypothetical protein